MWNSFKELLSGLMLIFSLLWILLHLIMIKVKGRVVIGEDNKWVLKLEITMIALLTLLGIERFIKDLKQ